VAAHASTTPEGQVPRRHADDILARLAEQVGARLTSSTIFGAPVERDGVTVIPVGTVRFGFGGGGGSDAGGKGEGEGGGAVGSGGPAGYIELKDGRSRFVPIVHPARMLALICATFVGGILIAELGRGSSHRSRAWHRLMP
jgi:uncharacterized spore protein YtfJ